MLGKALRHVGQGISGDMLQRVRGIADSLLGSADMFVVFALHDYAQWMICSEEIRGPLLTMCHSTCSKVGFLSMYDG